MARRFPGLRKHSPGRIVRRRVLGEGRLFNFGAAMPSSRDTAGIVLSLIGSIGLGAAIGVARIAYDEGANGLSIALPRAWLLVAVMLIFCEATGRGLRLPPRVWLHAAGAGACLTYMFYGNIAAAEFIPGFEKPRGEFRF